MAKAQSWEVSDTFWEKVSPLVPSPERDPNKNYRRKSGGGRKPIEPRQIFEAIAHRLPMEGSAKGAVWQPKRNSHSFHALDACWLLCFNLACRPC